MKNKNQNEFNLNQNQNFNYEQLNNNFDPNYYNPNLYQQQGIYLNNQNYYNNPQMLNQPIENQIQYNPQFVPQFQQQVVDINPINEKNLTLFKNEKNWVIIKVILFSIILLALIGFCGLLIYYQVNSQTVSIPSWYSVYYFIIVGLGIIVILVFWVLQIIDLRHWIEILLQLKQIGSFKMNATDFIRNFYKKSIKSYISLNWFCGYIYFMWLVSILFAFILSYVAHIYAFGGYESGASFGQLNWKQEVLDNEKMKNDQILIAFSVLPVCTLIFGSILVGIMIVVQLVNIIVFKLRKKALENNFNNIFSYDTYYAITKATNKANFIAYCILTLIFLIALIIFIFVTKKVLKK